MVAVPHAMVGVNGDNTLTLVPGTTTFAAWTSAPAHIQGEYATWVFGGVQPYQDQTDFFTLWNPPISAAERLVDVNPIADTINYTWPPVLLDLLIVPNVLSSSSINVATRPRYVEGINDRSVVLISTYFSNTPWTRYECQTDLPHPGTVKGDVYGHDVIFPECLHEDVFMESVTNDDAVIYDCMPNESSSRQGNVIHFPATNHTTWRDHIIDVKTATVSDGLYRRTVTTVFAPPMPEITYA